MKPQTIEISHKTVIFTIILLASLALLWYIKGIIILFFFCFIFMEAINPTINRLEKLKIPRPLAIVILYLLILAVLYFAFASLVPIFIEQTTALIKALPDMLKNINIFGASITDLSSQLNILGKLSSNIAGTTVSIFSDIFAIFVMFVITFYLLLERKNFGKYCLIFFGPKGCQKSMKIIDRLESRLGNWVNAEILLMTIIGILSYLGYLILGLKYAIPLAIIAGLLEVVPNIGPIISGAFAIIIALTISPFTGLLTLIWMIIVHQSENHFITPKIMKETCGLNPLITILVLAIGAKLAGIVGAVLAVPVYLTIEVVVKVLMEKENQKLQRTC